MKKGLLLTGVLAVAGLSVYAAPTCSTMSGSNNVIAGLTNGLQTPTSGPQDNPCSVSPLTFQNFSYNLDEGSFTSGTPTVNLIQANLTGNTVNMEFNPNLSGPADLEFEFQVLGQITGVTLSYNGTTGFVTEEVCTVFSSNDLCPMGDQIGSTLSVTPGTTSASETFATATNVWIMKDINVGSGGALSEVAQGYLVPEPMTLSLMGVGLLGVGLLGRRLRR